MFCFLQQVIPLRLPDLVLDVRSHREPPHLGRPQLLLCPLALLVPDSDDALWQVRARRPSRPVTSSIHEQLGSAAHLVADLPPCRLVDAQSTETQRAVVLQKSDLGVGLEVGADTLTLERVNDDTAKRDKDGGAVKGTDVLVDPVELASERGER